MNGGAGTVINYGSVAAGGGGGGEGVLLLTGGSVINEAGGSITGGLGVGGNGVTVVNRGYILGVDVAYGSSVTNAASGTIIGGFRSRSGGTLTNAGSIIGNSGTAVNFYGSSTYSNLVVLDPGFEFSGLVIGSSSASNTLELASAASAGTVTGLGTQFLHFNSIVFDAGAEWSVAGIARAFAGTISGFAVGNTIDVTGGGPLSATINGGGKLQLDDGTFGDTAAQISDVGSVVVDAGAVPELTGGGALPGTISGAGGLELTGTAPYTLAGGQTLGTATLILDPGFSVVGTVQGDGATTIELAEGSGAGTLGGLGSKFLDFGTLDFDPGAAWAVTLATPTTLTRTIAGFAYGDTIDLIGTAATRATYSDGELTALKGGKTVAVLNLMGSYTTSDFILGSDGHGGTDIMIRPPSPSGLSFAVGVDDGSSGDTMTVAGTGEAGDTVTLYDGTTPVGTALVETDGSWSITTASPLAVGAHSLRTSEVDGAGEKSLASPVQSLTISSAAPNAVTFVGTAGTDDFTGGAGNDIFKFSAADLANSDTVVGGAGKNELLMTTAGAVLAGGVSGVETYKLANGVANSLTLADTNFAGVGGATITIYAGDGSSTVDASMLIGTNRVIVVGGMGEDNFTGGAGNDIFEFSAAELAATDTVAGRGGTNVLRMTTAGIVAAAGVSGVEIYELADGGANSLTLVDANFGGVTSGTITVDGGNAGNTISEAGVSAADKAVLNGGTGADTLTAGQNARMTGGAGTNVFEFTTPGTTATPDKNTVTGFTDAVDRLAFSNAGFNFGLPNPGTTPRALPAGLFSSRTNGTFDNSDERFAYNAATGALYYDAQGKTAGSSRQLVATLTGHPTLSAGDLFYVS
jgi:Bacterial Ig-like domain